MNDFFFEKFTHHWSEMLHQARRAQGGASATKPVHPLSVEELPAGSATGLISPEEVSTWDGPAPAARERCLRDWRFRAERLVAADPGWAFVPADPARRDQTIWQALDDEARMLGANADDASPAFLGFAIGPVQPFIEAAHTVRDLWTGSYLLAYLTFRALKPVIDAYGPWSVIFPAPRGMPLVDRALFPDRSALFSGPEDTERLLLPCLPNRFVALVPDGGGHDASAMARRCQEECRRAWSNIAEAVRSAIGSEIIKELDPDLARDWDRLWGPQIESYFEVRTAAVPWSACDASTVERLADKPPDFDELPNPVRQRRGDEATRLYAGRLSILGGVLDALRSVRHVPAYQGEADAAGLVPAKCTLLGSFEQMGPAERAASRRFWEQFAERVSIQGTRVRSGEALCAVSLVKRFAWAAYFQKELGLELKHRRFSDTATAAARVWLDRAEETDPQLRIDPDEAWKIKKDWSGQWLHWQRRDEQSKEGEKAVPVDLWKQIQRKIKRQGAPPLYYAVLALDGDRMGQWIRGEGDKSPTLNQVVDEAALGLSDQERASLATARRPIHPTLHAAISEAAANFAMFVAPSIVESCHGELIYAGGDDVLALLPVETALDCAGRLRDAFSQKVHDANGRPRLLMGGKATASAGIAVAHYKEDLRYALQAARHAEEQAKEHGRDRLGLTIIRRSGEETSAVLPWGLVGRLDELRRRFTMPNHSDRWAYALRLELPTLQGLEDDEALKLELKRVLKRVEHEAFRDWLQERVPPFFDQYRSAFPQSASAGEAFAGFVTLCQSASFLARGRDR